MAWGMSSRLALIQTARAAWEGGGEGIRLGLGRWWFGSEELESASTRIPVAVKSSTNQTPSKAERAAEGREACRPALSHASPTRARDNSHVIQPPRPRCPWSGRFESDGLLERGDCECLLPYLAAPAPLPSPPLPTHRIESHQSIAHPFFAPSPPSIPPSSALLAILTSQRSIISGCYVPSASGIIALSHDPSLVRS